MILGTPPGLSLADSPPPPIGCRLKVVPRGLAGQAVRLSMRLTNAGTTPLHVLTWNTPFEGDWFGPFVEVFREGQPLPYQGPMLKRGDPQADEYLTLGAKRSREASLDLAQAFDLSRPGRYRVVPVAALADVAPETTRRPRSRDSFQAQALACPPLDFTLP